MADDKRELEPMSETNLSPVNSFQYQSSIRDIDAFDSDDPFFMTTYSKDIFAYMKEEENNSLILHDFMENQFQLTPNMKQIIVNWISEMINLLE